MMSVIFHRVKPSEMRSWCKKKSQMVRVPSACCTMVRTSPVSESARLARFLPRKCVSDSTNSTVVA